MLYCNLQHEINENELSLIDKLDNQLKQGYRLKQDEDEYECKKQLDYYIENIDTGVINYKFEGNKNAVSKMILTLYCSYHPAGYNTCITSFKMLPNDNIHIEMFRWSSCN